MLKGSRTSLSDGEPTNDRPRKKLSFREPEVMGAAVREKLETDRHWEEEQGRRKTDESVRRKISGDRSVVDSDCRRTNTDWSREPVVDVAKRKSDLSEEAAKWSEPLPEDAVRRKEERRRESPVEETSRRRTEKGLSETERRRVERSLTADRDWLHRRISEEDEDELESQAMKIVRTVGQAFEVCHKLSINSPDDEQDPLHDASSDKDSEAYSDLPRKGDGMSDIVDDSDLNLETPPPANRRHLHLDMIPPPPTSLKISSAPVGIGETITSPLLDPLQDSSDGVPVAGTPLSAHHEIQLLREQLEQQSQQTHAAVAQVHLLRDQLAAETTARIEAQARTHQLLVHNKELLDHITALVSHLQEQERVKPESNVTVIPQFSQAYNDLYDTRDMESDLPLDHRNSGAYVTAPSSPKARHTPFYHSQQAMGSLYSLAFPTPEQQFQAQLLQRLQSLTAAYPPLLSPQVYPSIPAYNLCSFPTSYTFPKEPPRERLEDPPPRLDPPPTRRARTEPASPRLATSPPPSRPRGSPPSARSRVSPPPKSRASPQNHQPPPKSRVSPQRAPPSKSRSSPLNVPNIKTPKSPSPVSSPASLQPNPIHSPKSSYQNAFASALSTIRTLRVTGAPEKGKKLLASTSNTQAPPITRSTSEKVQNRSELMDLVQRTAWARQTK